MMSIDCRDTWIDEEFAAVDFWTKCLCDGSFSVSIDSRPALKPALIKC